MAPRRPLLPQTNDSQRRNADFIQHFAQRAAEKRNAKRPKTLTVAQHAALRKRLEGVHFFQPEYADSTKTNIAGMLRKWKKYCELHLSKNHWQKEMEKADKATVQDFLLHLCETYKIQSWGTSYVYFRLFKQLYASTTGRYLDRNDSKEISKWHDDTLKSHFQLRAPNTGGKDVAESGDLLALQTFNIAYDTGIFSGERHRIQLSGCYLALAFTGARPAEFVNGEKNSSKNDCLDELFARKALGDPGEDDDTISCEDSRVIDDLLTHETIHRGRPKALCYEDVLLMVVRHPDTGDDILAMSIRLVHHKGADHKPKPTIFFFTPTKRLIFCLISVIVSLAVHDGAFAAPSLTSARRVFQVKNMGPVKCTPLRWKEEWLKRPVFRHRDDTWADSGLNEPVDSKYRPMPYQKLRDDMSRQSLDCGCEKPIEPKAWRRGAANAANGRASDAVRDQMMRHDPKWATFNSAYINEKVQFHLQNAFLDEPSEDSLIKMLSHLGLTRDPRAKKDMVPDEVWENMPPDPEVAALIQERAQLKGGRFRIKGTESEGRIRELTKLIASKQAQRDNAIRREYRAHHFHNRPTWDIERQVNGDWEEEGEEEYLEPIIDLRIPERARLADLLCSQPDDLSPADLLERRIQAAELMIALCGKKETARQKRIRQRARTEVSVKEESPEPDPFPLLMQRTQCPRCIGDETLPFEERTFRYCRPAVMYDHFDRKHAKQLGGTKPMVCSHPKCRERALEFKHLNHFKNHVEVVHGVKLRA